MAWAMVMAMGLFLAVARANSILDLGIWIWDLTDFQEEYQ